jgi:Tfp pilus assembly PilM family ATPase
VSGAAGRPGVSLRRAGRWVVRTLVEPPLPLLAVEVRPRALAAVRLAREGGGLSLGAAATVELPAGVIEVSLARPNVIDPEAFRGTLRAVLERVGALSGGDVSLVLPDPAVRLALIPAEGLRGRRDDAEETIRFRLHKALPFDVRAARLAWALPRDEQTLVAVAPEDVVRGYEEALESLGFQPGLVEVASLALLSTVEAGPGDRMLVNWEQDYVSFVLTRAGRPLLLRTLPGDAGRDAVTRHATSTMQFHRDRLGGGSLTGVVLRSAAVPGDEAAALLERALEAPVRLLRPWTALGIMEEGASAQAVAGAAACVLRRAA